jgi:hypothetical protein
MGCLGTGSLLRAKRARSNWIICHNRYRLLDACQTIVVAIERSMQDVFDWQRLRAQALEPLLASQSARWRPFDFAAGLHPDGTYALSEQLAVR